MYENFTRDFFNTSSLFVIFGKEVKETTSKIFINISMIYNYYYMHTTDISRTFKLTITRSLLRCPAKSIEKIRRYVFQGLPHIRNFAAIQPRCGRPTSKRISLFHSRRDYILYTFNGV